MRFPVFCVELLIAEHGTKVCSSKSTSAKVTGILGQKDSQFALKKQKSRPDAERLCQT